MEGETGTIEVQKIYINLKSDHLELNTGDGDGRPCTHCLKPIPVLYMTRDNRKIVFRENRVDCELNGRIECYHLVCYDLLLLGKIHRITQRKLEQIKLMFPDNC